MALPVRPPQNANEVAVHLISMLANPALRRLHYADQYKKKRALELNKRIDYSQPSHMKQREKRLRNIDTKCKESAQTIATATEAHLALVIDRDVLIDIVNADVADMTAQDQDDWKAIHATQQRQNARATEVEVKTEVRSNKKRRRERDVFAEAEHQVDTKHNLLDQEAEEATEQQIVEEDFISAQAAAQEEAAADGHSVFSEGRLAARVSSSLAMNTS